MFEELIKQQQQTIDESNKKNPRVKGLREKSSKYAKHNTKAYSKR